MYCVKYPSIVCGDAYLLSQHLRNRIRSGGQEFRVNLFYTKLEASPSYMRCCLKIPKDDVNLFSVGLLNCSSASGV